MLYANDKGAGQPVHPRSLISAFVVRCLDSVVYLVFVNKLSSLLLASVAEEASLSLTWSETPKDTFNHGEAQMYLPLHGMCRICTLYLQSVNFMQMLTQSIWSFKLYKCFCLTQQFCLVLTSTD